jgi:hypothetical protein
MVWGAAVQNTSFKQEEDLPQLSWSGLWKRTYAVIDGH